MKLGGVKLYGFAWIELNSTESPQSSYVLGIRTHKECVYGIGITAHMYPFLVLPPPAFALCV